MVIHRNIGQQFPQSVHKRLHATHILRRLVVHLLGHTDDNTLYGQVKNLGDKLAKATGLDELADDFGDLWARITGM